MELLCLRQSTEGSSMTGGTGAICFAASARSRSIIGPFGYQVFSLLSIFPIRYSLLFKVVP